MDSSADKEGLQSSGRKEQSTRHGTEPAPGTSPVPGAFGREGFEIPPDPDEREEYEAGLGEDDLELDDDDLELDDDVTEEEAERADGA